MDGWGGSGLEEGTRWRCGHNIDSEGRAITQRCSVPKQGFCSPVFSSWPRLGHAGAPQAYVQMTHAGRADVSSKICTSSRQSLADDLESFGRKSPLPGCLSSSECSSSRIPEIRGRGTAYNEATVVLTEPAWRPSRVEGATRISGCRQHAKMGLARFPRGGLSPVTSP